MKLKIIIILFIIIIISYNLFADTSHSNNSNQKLIQGFGLALPNKLLPYPYYEIGYKFYRLKALANVGFALIWGEFSGTIMFRLFNIYNFENSFFLNVGNRWVIVPNEGDEDQSNNDLNYWGIGYEIILIPSNFYIRISYEKADNDLTVRRLVKPIPNEITLRIGYAY